MNFDEIIVKESPGLCRCCLSEGCYKDLGSEYTWMNDREVYADMLLDCFDIGITQHNDGPNGAKRLICEVCITRLRDACNFKKQVLDSEKRFIDMLGRGEFRPKVLLYQPQNQEMKAETVEPAEADLTDVEYLEDIDFGDEDEEIKTEEIQSTSMPTTSEEPEPPKLKRGRPKKEEEKPEKPTKVVKKAKVSKGLEKKKSVWIVFKPKETSYIRNEPPIRLTYKIKQEKEVDGRKEAHKRPDYEKRKRSDLVLMKQNKPSGVYIVQEEPAKEVVYKQEEQTNTGKVAMKVNKDSVEEPETLISTARQNKFKKRNAIIILQNSTAIPFKWHKQKYYCFFCTVDYSNIDELKQHTGIEHSNTRIKHTVSLLKGDENIKIDISASQCKLCQHRIRDLSSFIEHLKDRHNQVFSEGQLGVIPYRIGNGKYQCAVCDENFEYFLKLNHHMNRHFGFHVCELCGKAFLSQLRLRSHSLTHRSKFNCNICNELFPTRTQKVNHDHLVHNKPQILKCFYCPETFYTYPRRKRHLINVHGIEIQKFECAICDKSFANSSRLKAHEKRVHFKEKNFTCDYCGYKVFSKTAIASHIATHMGNIYKCGICMKSYNRKNHLNLHMKTHKIIRRI